MMKILIKKLNKHLLALSFFIATSATIASMVLSNVLGLVPCELCWYQRIFMFPLPFIFGIALLRNDKKAYLYALPLIVIGWLIAFYQNLLQWGIISEDASSCSLTSQSCAEPQIQLLGFMTIPFGSWLTFSALGALTWLLARQDKFKHGITTKSQKMFLRLLLLIFALTALSIALLELLDVQV